MQIKTKGIVLKVQDYNENDKLLSVLTEDRGVIYAYASGARRMKSALATVSSMLCYGEFVFFKNREKYTVDSAESERLFFGIRKDLDSLAYASYFCELCLSAANPEEDSKEILRLLLNTLHMLENKKVHPAMLKAIFELRLMSLIGYAPDLIACSECGEFEKGAYWFDTKTGSATCTDCRPNGANGEVLLSKAAFLAARHIVYAPMEQLFSFRVGENSLIELSNAAEKYVIEQMDKVYPTLEFLNSIRSF